MYLDRAKKWAYHHLQEYGFLGIMLFASVRVVRVVVYMYVCVSVSVCVSVCVDVLGPRRNMGRFPVPYLLWRR